MEVKNFLDDPRLYASLGSIPLAIRTSSGRRRICWAIRPGVALGQELGEVPARRLVLERDVGEGAASGVTLARKPVGLARLLARHQRFDDLARQLDAVVTQSSPHERRP